MGEVRGEAYIISFLIVAYYKAMRVTQLHVRDAKSVREFAYQ